MGSYADPSSLHLRLPAGKYALRLWPGGAVKVSAIQIAPEACKATSYQSDFQYQSVPGVCGNASFPNSSIPPRSAEMALLAMKELTAANWPADAGVCYFRTMRERGMNGRSIQ